MSEAIVHSGVAVLKLATPELLAEIRALLPMSEFEIAQLSPCEVVIDPARASELSRLLAERGLAPLTRRGQSPT